MTIPRFMLAFLVAAVGYQPWRTALAQEAPPIRSVVVPTFTIGNRIFFDLSDWLGEPPPAGLPQLPECPSTDAPLHPDTASFRLPTTFNKDACLLPLPQLPEVWQAPVGSVVPAYTADGTACAATMGSVYLLDLVVTGRFTSGQPHVVAELLPQATCQPVLLTNAPAPAFFALAPDADELAVAPVVAALQALLPPPDSSEEPANLTEAPSASSVQSWQSGAGRTLWLGQYVRYTEAADGCGGTSDDALAVFEPGPAGPPQMLGATHDSLGDVLAIVDATGSGPVSVILGAAEYDRGMEGQSLFVSLVRLTGAAAEVDEVSFGYYIGCD